MKKIDYKKEIIALAYKNYSIKQAEKLEELLEADFYNDELVEIEYGLKNNLTMKQIQLYAKPEFNIEQMREIRNGFKIDGLAFEQVKLYATPEFNSYQMSDFRWGFRKKVSLEYLSLHADKLMSEKSAKIGEEK